MFVCLSLACLIWQFRHLDIPEVLCLFLFSDSLEEQDVFDNSTEQRDDKIPVTEQTSQVIEKTSGPEEPEENQEETENEETSTSEAKSPVLRADSVSNLEPSEESLVTK